VAERRQEIGIRVALGASGSGVMGLVAKQALGLTVVGTIVGVGGGYVVSRMLGSRLYEVTGLDPTTYLLAGAGFGLVALVASTAPARAAASVDPVTTLNAG